MNNLFVNIQKYRPRENTNPKENFFTEILAFILNKDKDLFKNFISLIGLDYSIETSSINTQVLVERKIIDMEIIINDSISIFIENKIDSTINKSKGEKDGSIFINNQLENYIKIQNSKTKQKGYVVLLTQYSESIDKKIGNQLLTQIFWEDVYSLLKNHSSKNNISKFLIDQFIYLMEDENMNPYTQITKEMINGHNNFIENVKKLFENIMKSMEKNNTIEGNTSQYSYSFIDYYFTFENIKCSLNYDRNDMTFSLYIKQKNLSKWQKEKLNNLDFEKNSVWFWTSFEINDEFLNYDSNKQLDILKKFYIEKFDFVKNIIT